MDVYLSLYTGGTICAITKEVQKNLKLLYKVLPTTDVNVWVSTPSFADVCLSDRSYNKDLLPNLKYFLFCGEILTNRTVEKLYEAFPESIVVNTYGPTESTVCVTEVVVDKEVLSTYSPLPVGVARPGTWLYIISENGDRLPDGEQGEIIIVGDTVSTGYYKNPEQSQKAFSTETIDGVEYRLYHTGDKGYIKNGQLFYCGRIDFQIKLHGYRIEIEDIENNLVKVGGVEKAVVLPNMEDNKVKSLTAYVVYEYESCESSDKGGKNQRSEFVLAKKYKRSAEEFCTGIYGTEEDKVC
jgi:D-alanine--poly(phosphoribitol) ligase subunit 1